jgi:hypothetical protein
MKSSLHRLIPFLPLFCNCQLQNSTHLITTQIDSSSTELKQSQSQSHVATDGQSVSKSWCRDPIWGSWPDIFYYLTFTVFFCAPLTRGRVCLLYMLLALASAVFLGSESLETRDYILLSQTRDFPFRRLLRLAGSRWRYSTPPPHGSELKQPCLSVYNPCERITQKTASLLLRDSLLIRCLAIDVIFVARVGSAGMCLMSRCLAMDLYVTICFKSFHCVFPMSREAKLDV